LAKLKSFNQITLAVLVFLVSTLVLYLFRGSLSELNSGDHQN